MSIIEPIDFSDVFEKWHDGGALEDELFWRLFPVGGYESLFGFLD